MSRIVKYVFLFLSIIFTYFGFNSLSKMYLDIAYANYIGIVVTAVLLIASAVIYLITYKDTDKVFITLRIVNILPCGYYFFLFLNYTLATIKSNNYNVDVFVINTAMFVVGLAISAIYIIMLLLPVINAYKPVNKSNAGV